MECVKNVRVDGQYFQINHPSGITLYYYPMPEKSKASAMIATKFGSMNREFKKYQSEEWMVVPDGIAHFLEHKLFEGPQGNAFDFYAKTGAKANAYTSNDRTAYYFVTSENFYESLDILLRFVKHPYFTAENVEKEKGIIGQEIRMYDDEPSWQGYIALVQALYQNHPVRIDIAGTVDTISEITDTTLYDCYNVFYNNANLSLCIAGDLDLDKILEVCDRQLPVEQSDKIVQKIPQEPQEIAIAFVSKKMDVSKTQFFIGLKDPDAVVSGNEWAKHELSVKILQTILFGESSRFFKELYQAGVLNPEFSADYENGVGFGFLLFAGESDQPETVVEKIKSICDGFTSDMITIDDFRRVRNALYGDMIRGLDNAESLVNRFVAHRLMDGDIFSLINAINNLTIDDVINTGKRLLNSERVAMSLIYPKER